MVNQNTPFLDQEKDITRFYNAAREKSLLIGIITAKCFGLGSLPAHKLNMDRIVVKVVHVQGRFRTPLRPERQFSYYVRKVGKFVYIIFPSAVNNILI